MSRKEAYTDWNAVPVIFDIPIACVLMGRNYDTIKRWCEVGKIPAHNTGNGWLFEKEVFRDWIKKLMQGGETTCS